jgi:parvulin-like peptidyl-prolyl isomerase
MKLFAAALIVLTLASCREERQGTIIARVGDATLTREAALRAVDTTRGEVDRQIRAYVISWVNTELLHQEALRRGIEKSERFVQQVEDVKRQLAVQALLEAEIVADTAAVSEETLKAYFAAHASEFFLREDMIRLNMMVLAGREEASALAASVSQGTPWKSAAEKLSSDSSVAPSIRLTAAGEFYSRRTLLPADLWKVASTLSPGEVSFPVRIADGFAVLQLLARLGEGRPAEFEFVRDEIAQRVLMERRRTRSEALLASLRSSVKIQVMLSPASASDTTHQFPHE